MTLPHPFYLVILLMSVILVGSGCRETAETDEPPVHPKLTQYDLVIPETYKTGPFSKPYTNWRDSLVRDPGYQPSKIHLEEFLVTDRTLKESGTASGHAVHVSRKSSNLILVPEVSLVIDFNEKVIGTGGTSIHLTNDQNYGVVIQPGGSKDFLGVLLGDLKTDSPKPTFTAPKSVTFFR